MKIDAIKWTWIHLCVFVALFFAKRTDTSKLPQLIELKRKIEQFISIAIDFISFQTENDIMTAPSHDVWI